MARSAAGPAVIGFGGENRLRYALASTMAVTSLIAAIGFARAMRGRDQAVAAA